MNYQVFMAFALFAFVSSITPGPNNLMLLTSGVHFGFKRSLPHMLGVSIGFGFMLIAVSLGFHQLLIRFPMALELMKWLGIAYLLWLAIKLGFDRTAIASDSHNSANATFKPMTFLGACAFQWINPKAWFMAVTACSAYSPSLLDQPSPLTSALAIAAIFTAVNLPSVASWAWGGTKLRLRLANPKYLRRFNIAMALLLVTSTAPIILESY